MVTPASEWTSTSDGNGLGLGTYAVLRVYIVPHDLTGIQRTFRSRSAQRVINPALKILPKLLDNICRLKDVWQGQEPGGSMASQGEPMPIIPEYVSEVRGQFSTSSCNF